MYMVVYMDVMDVLPGILEPVSETMALASAVGLDGSLLQSASLENPEKGGKCVFWHRHTSHSGSNMNPTGNPRSISRPLPSAREQGDKRINK